MHYQEILDTFASLEGGQPRLSYMRDAISQADEEKHPYWQFMLRYMYLKESIFCGDRYFAMIMFPELLALYDQEESLQNNSNVAFHMLIAFKWIVEAAPEFPQITKAEIDSYFRLFKKRLLEQGCSLSIYYMKRSLFYLHCDLGIASAAFYDFLDAPLDHISDGKALYYDQQVIYYLHIGEEERALQAAKRIFSGELTSNALPQATYHMFMQYYTKQGRYEEALSYAEKTLRRIEGDAYYLDIIGSLMTLYGITDSMAGLSVFRKHYPVYLSSKNPYLRMLFTIGAYQLFSRMQAPLPEDFALPKQSPIQTTDAAALAAHFYQLAKESAGRFDSRNGTEDFMQLLEYPYPQP